MELEFDRARWMQDDAGCWLCLRVTAAQAARAFVAGMKDAVYTVCMKRKRQKRSLDANAYAWVLMEKIAAAVGRSKDDIYLDMLERYGVFTHLIVKPTAGGPADAGIPVMPRSWRDHGQRKDRPADSGIFRVVPVRYRADVPADRWHCRRRHKTLYRDSDAGGTGAG